MPVESLVFEASVIEDFEDTLTNLATGLAEIDRLATETVEDIEADVKIGDALEDLGELETSIKAVDDDINVGANANSQRVFDGDGPLSRLNDTELASVLDLQSGFSTHVPTQGGGNADSDTVPSSDGGFNILPEERIAEAKEAFGDAFDSDALVDDSGQITDATDLLSGQLSDFVDSDVLTERLLDDDSDLSVTDLIPDGDADLPGLNVIQSLPDDLTDLPDVSNSLIERFKDLELKMGDFFKIFATLLPLLSMFIGALPAAITGLVTLAGAAVAAAGTLGALGALTLFGMGRENGEFSLDNLTDDVEEVRDAFTDTFGPLADRLDSLGDSGVDSLVRTIDRLGGELAFLSAMGEEGRAVFAYLERTLPNVAGKFTRFGAAALPVLGVLDNLLAEFELINAFADGAERTLPLITTLLYQIGALIGPIIDLSMGFAVASAMLLGIVTGILNLLDTIPFLLEGLGMAASVLLILLTLSAAYTAIQGSMITSILATAKSWALAYVPAAIQAQLAQMGLTASTVALFTALTALFGLVTLGLAPAISSLSLGFTDLGSSIDDATSSLEQFNSANSTLSGVGSVSGSPNGDNNNPYDSSGFNGNTTVVAPDKETGTAVANTISFKKGTLDNPSEQNNTDSDRRN